MELFRTDEVIGVQAKANRFYQHDGSGLKALNKTSSLRLEREEIFKETGELRVVKPKFLNEKNKKMKKIDHVVLDRKSSHNIETDNIETDLDWKIAEII